MVMSAMPYLVIARSRRWRGMPSISCSMGTVIRLSTSSGVMPGALMMILTCVVETSGNASIGRPRSATTPALASSTVRTSTRRRCVSEKSTIRASIPGSFGRADAAQGGLELAGAAAHDELAFAQLGLHDQVLAGFADRPGGDHHVLLAALGEHRRLLARRAQADDRIGRDEPERCRGIVAAHGDLGLDVLAGTEPVQSLRHSRPHRQSLSVADRAADRD